MTPEQRHADAVEAAREWRDEEREQASESGHLERVWFDSGSGPGYEVLAPRPKLRPDRDKLS